MEFLSVDGMHRLLKSAGWTKRDILDAVNTGQLAAIKIQTRTGREKLAIVHPGLQFLEFLNDPLVKMGHVGILSDRDVAVILNKSRTYIRWLVHKKKIKFIPGGVRGRYLRFTPEAVRQYIIRTSGRDPKQRREPTAEVLVEWFWRLMKLQSTSDPVAVVDEDLRHLDELPEPERSLHIQKMMRLAEEAREQLAQATIRKD